ncbi:helix-turn-helix domain-containing protein [Bacillus toyonensis]
MSVGGSLRFFVYGRCNKNEMQSVSEKVYKFRIYPNKKKEILIAKTIGCSRFVFNRFIALLEDAYKGTGKGKTFPLALPNLLNYRSDMIRFA